jgi:putative transposase
MECFQSFRFELKPNGQQRRAMQCFAGACRFVFNKALDIQKARHEGGERKLGYVELCKLLTDWRHDAATPWLGQAPTHPLQQSLKDLERAYDNFFAGRAATPRFKKKGRSDSFRYPDPQQIKLEQGNNRIFLPKLGWLRYRNSRSVLGSVRNVTVSQHVGRWFVVIQSARDFDPIEACGKAVGVDMGIVRFATLSDGDFVEPINSFKNHAVRLRKAQQALSRKVKYSHNWGKAKTRVQRIHACIGNARKDYLHKITRTICNNHAIVYIEDLRVKQMSKSAAGTHDAPGHKVRAKSGLNKAILDQGWHEFRRQLGYKLAWKGGVLLAVPPHRTSQTCPACGHISPDNRRTQSLFACVSCGYENHADVVGAINVLRRGETMIRSKGRDDARFACVVNGELMPSSAGTLRGGSSQLTAGGGAVGISVLSA